MDISLIKDSFYIVLAIISIYQFVKAQRKDQTKPIEELKLEVKALREIVTDHSSKLATDNDRFAQLEEGQKAMLTSLLALLSHSIDGNNDAEMREARTELQKYLVRK